MHPYIHTSIHVCIRPYIHTYIHTYVHAYIHTSIHTSIHCSQMIEVMKSELWFVVSWYAGLKRKGNATYSYISPSLSLSLSIYIYVYGRSINVVILKHPFKSMWFVLRATPIQSQFRVALLMGLVCLRACPRCVFQLLDLGEVAMSYVPSCIYESVNKPINKSINQ